MTCAGSISTMRVSPIAPTKTVHNYTPGLPCSRSCCRACSILRSFRFPYRESRGIWQSSGQNPARTKMFFTIRMKAVNTGSACGARKPSKKRSRLGHDVHSLPGRERDTEDTTAWMVLNRQSDFSRFATNRDIDRSFVAPTSAFMRLVSAAQNKGRPNNFIASFRLIWPLQS
jgi:hypothetical protein